MELRGPEFAHPDFLSPHNNLAGIYFDEGNDSAYLRELAAAADLEHDRVRQALLITAASAGLAAAGLAAAGLGGMLAAIVKEQTIEFQA